MPFMEFDNWLMTSCNSALTPLNECISYYNNIKAAIELLGADNVGIFLFEELCMSPQQYYTDMANFLGISVDESLTHIIGKHYHPRMLEGHVHQMRTINDSFLRRLIWRITMRKARWALLHLMRGRKDTEPASVALTDELRENISNATREDHRRLMKQYNLNISVHGYPC